MTFKERINLDFPLEVLSKDVCKEYDLGTFVDNKLIEIGYEDYNYILTTSKGKFVVKVFSNLRTDEDCQNLADRGSAPHKYGFSCPKIYEANGKNLLVTTLNNVKFRLLVMEYINGKDFFTLNELPTLDDLKLIGEETAKLNQIDFRPPFIYDSWAIINFEKEYKHNIKYIKDESKLLIDKAYKEFKAIDFSKLKYGYVHGDIIETNVLRDENKKLWFIDFSVANYLPRIIDLAITICDLCLDLDDANQSVVRTKTYLLAYEKLYPLTDYERQCLKIAIKCHQAITVLETTREKVEENNDSIENQKFLEKGEQGLKMVNECDLIEGVKYENTNHVIKF